MGFFDGLNGLDPKAEAHKKSLLQGARHKSEPMTLPSDLAASIAKLRNELSAQQRLWVDSLQKHGLDAAMLQKRAGLAFPRGDIDAMVIVALMALAAKTQDDMRALKAKGGKAGGGAGLGGGAGKFPGGGMPAKPGKPGEDQRKFGMPSTDPMADMVDKLNDMMATIIAVLKAMKEMQQMAPGGIKRV